MESSLSFLYLIPPFWHSPHLKFCSSPSRGMSEFDWNNLLLFPLKLFLFPCFNSLQIRGEIWPKSIRCILLHCYLKSEWKALLIELQFSQWKPTKIVAKTPVFVLSPAYPVVIYTVNEKYFFLTALDPIFFCIIKNMLISIWFIQCLSAPFPKFLVTMILFYLWSTLWS